MSTGAGGRSVPFIGRREERRVLTELLDGVRDGRSGTLVLAGEPGTGKTSRRDLALSFQR